jgi:hypothetical protein
MPSRAVGATTSVAALVPLMALRARSGHALEATFSHDFTTLQVHHGGNVVLGAADDVALFADCAWHGPSDGSLEFVAARNISGQSAVLGSWTGVEVDWVTQPKASSSAAAAASTAGGVRLVTRVKNAASGENVLFEYNLPDGANDTSLVRCGAGDNQGVIVEFPAFTSVAFSDALSWSGSFSQGQRSSPGSMPTGSTGGPAVLFNGTAKAAAPGSIVLVGSSTTNFMSWSAGAGRTRKGTKPAWVPGTTGTVTSIPANFTHDLLLHATPVAANAAAPPITQALYEWGSILRQLHGGATKIDDITVSTIGYQTDNGATYCFCQGNCSKTLLDVNTCVVVVVVVVCW